MAGFQQTSQAFEPAKLHFVGRAPDDFAVGNVDGVHVHTGNLGSQDAGPLLVVLRILEAALHGLDGDGAGNRNAVVPLLTEGGDFVPEPRERQ